MTTAQSKNPEVELPEVELPEVESPEVELAEKYTFVMLAESMQKFHSDIASLFYTSNYLTSGVLSATMSILQFMNDDNFLVEFGHIVLTGIETGKTKNQKKVTLDLSFNQIYELATAVNVCAQIWGEQGKIEAVVDLRKVFAKQA